MAFASGINKSLRVKKQAALGTPPGATGAVELRRVTSGLQLLKNTYESEELVSDYQVSDYRHGTRRTEGPLEGELSPGTYQLLMAAMLRKDFATGATSGALINVTAAAGPPGTFTRAAGSWITDGFRQGDVVRWTGWTTTGAGNNARNYRITDLTATVMTVPGTGDEVVAAKAAGDSVTATVVGKKTWTPLTGHTSDYLTFEHWHSDVVQSERFDDTRVNSASFRLPASGLARVSFGLLGRDMTPATSAYFTSPAAAPTTGITAAVSGVVRLQGADVAVITSITLNYAGGFSTLDVVGSNLSPDVFPGIVRVSGELVAAFENGTIRDYFINETEVDLQVMLRLSNVINADFLNFYLGRIKLGGATKDDGPKPLIQTLPFFGLRDTTGSATKKEPTTLSIQDSTLV